MRRFFVPEDGGFARVVDTIENVGQTPMAPSYRVRAGFGLPEGTVTEIFGNGVIDATDPAFVLQTSEPTGEVAGFALRAPASPSPSLFDHYDGVSYRQTAFGWADVSLEPGEKKSFMSFVVFGRGPGAASTVTSRVQALLNLTDPTALQGLSAEERALIVNWILP